MSELMKIRMSLFTTLLAVIIMSLNTGKPNGFKFTWSCTRKPYLLHWLRTASLWVKNNTFTLYSSARR